MNKKSENIKYHIGYCIFVVIVLTLVFGSSWGSILTAFIYVSMLLPIVLGTSYFFNYLLFPKYYFTKRFVKFTVYTIYTAIISLYLAWMVLLFTFVVLEKLNLNNINPYARTRVLLAVILYLLVFIGSFLLLMKQIKENRKVIQQLMNDKLKLKKSYLEIMSNRKIVIIPYDEIIYIESLSDYIKVVTINDEIKSKEKISKIAEKLPDVFLRIHRSFIVNTDKIKERSLDEILVEDVRLNIGRSYRHEVKEYWSNNKTT